MKLYELKIEDDNVDEVFALSLVENPAIEADWVYFSKQQKEVKFATVDEDKHLIVAPVLIPDKQILRIDENTGEEYKVFFTRETVQKLAQKYLQNGYQNKATMEHSKNIDGDVTVVESWVSDSATKDKSNLYFNRSFPAGTWFITMKVNNDKLWKDYIKTGVVKAISLEGIFSHQLVQGSQIEMEILMNKEITELSEAEAAKVLKRFRQLIKDDKRFKSGKRKDIIDMDEAGHTNPSFPEGSSYAGGPAIVTERKKKAEKYIHPALINIKI